MGFRKSDGSIASFCSVLWCGAQAELHEISGKLWSGGLGSVSQIFKSTHLDDGILKLAMPYKLCQHSQPLLHGLAGILKHVIRGPNLPVVFIRESCCRIVSYLHVVV